MNRFSTNLTLDNDLIFADYTYNIKALSGKHTITFKFFGLFKEFVLDEFYFSKAE